MESIKIRKLSKTAKYKIINDSIIKFYVSKIVSIRPDFIYYSTELLLTIPNNYVLVIYPLQDINKTSLSLEPVLIIKDLTSELQIRFRIIKPLKNVKLSGYDVGEGCAYGILTPMINFSIDDITHK